MLLVLRPVIYRNVTFLNPHIRRISNKKKKVNLKIHRVCEFSRNLQDGGKKKKSKTMQEWLKTKSDSLICGTV